MVNNVTGQRNTRKYISNELRRIIVEKVMNNFESITKVARDLLLKRTTVSGIVRKFKTEQRIVKCTTRRRPALKISRDIGQMVERLVEVNPGITLVSIKREILQNFDLNVSVSTIRTYLISLKITLKKSGLVLERVNDEQRLNLRNEFSTQFLTTASLDDNKNVFVDESGFNLHLRRNFGRSRVGTRVTFIVPTIRGKNVTLLSAINASGIVLFKIFEGACTSEIFAEFLRELDNKLINVLNIPDATIYMDNASPHRAHLSQQQ